MAEPGEDTPLLACDGCERRAVKLYLDEAQGVRHWVAACGEHQVRNTNPQTLVIGVTTVMEAEIRG